MTEDEWFEIALVISDKWPHSDVSELTAERWGSDLADLDAIHVAAAVETLSRDGARFAPDSGQIRRRVVELTMDTPEWWKVLAELRGDTIELPPLCDECDRTGWIVADEDADAVPCKCRIQRLAAVRAHKQARHPLIRSFIEELGERQIKEGLEGSGSDEARLRAKWESFVEATRRDASRIGLPTGGLPALERANREGPQTMKSIIAGVAGELEPGD
jgi:hypothetical protein